MIRIFYMYEKISKIWIFKGVKLVLGYLLMFVKYIFIFYWNDVLVYIIIFELSG